MPKGILLSFLVFSLPSIKKLTDRTAFVKGGFKKTRTELVERPWAIDNLDQVLQRWQQKPHHKAMLFVDNAGTDVVLGEQQQCSPVAGNRFF